jgi:hypothetical protein
LWINEMQWDHLPVLCGDRGRVVLTAGVAACSTSAATKLKAVCAQMYGKGWSILTYKKVQLQAFKAAALIRDRSMPGSFW